MTTIPKGAKVPEDHAVKAKAEAEDQSMSVEHAGITYVMEREVINDVILLEMIGDLAENAFLMPQVVRRMLGKEQWAAFKAGNLDDAGRIPTERLHELFEALDDAAGKSSASPTS